MNYSKEHILNKLSFLDVVRHHCNLPEPDCVLPDSDLDHAAEQLWAVGDNPSNVDHQLLLKNSLPLLTIRGALAVDDTPDHPW